ncbi:MAG: PTS sugar transporter subunit IIA [Burkholderiaceae bacterium]
MVVSHEPLGTALLHCLRHIFGRLPPQVAALDVIPDEDPEFASGAARDLLMRINDGSGVIVLTDLYGATPSRIAMQLAAPHRVCVLAGVNLPLLLKAITHRRMPVEELFDLLIEAGREAIRPALPEVPGTGGAAATLPPASGSTPATGSPDDAAS